MKHFLKKSTLTLSLLLFIVLSLITFVARYSSQDYPPLDEPYFTLKKIILMQTTTFPYYDYLSIQPFFHDSFIWFIRLFSLFFSDQVMAIFIPLFLGAANFCLFYLLLTKLDLPEPLFAVTLFAYLLATPFLYMQLVLSAACFYLFLLLLTCYLLSFDHPFFFISAMITFFIGLLSQPHFALVILLGVTLFSLYRKKNMQGVLVIAALGILYQIIMFIYIGIPSLPLFSSFSPTMLLSHFGSYTGVDITFAMLALLGVLVCWHNKEMFAPLYLYLGLTTTLACFFPTIILLNFPLLAYFAAQGFLTMYHRTWSLPLLRVLTLTIILISIVGTFSYALYELSVAEPSPQLISSLRTLASQPPGTVLSHPLYGLWIQYFSLQPTVVDTFTYYADQRQAWNTSQTVFSSYQLAKTQEALNTIEASYIFITPAMREELIWDDPEEGLLFLLRNNETFKSISTTNHNQILLYNRP
jgi:hypothetical protein